ncbi:transcription termination factor NusA, partial [Candidatus Peregrinibacteria bacterium RIFOXYC2_FULL_33_13]
NIEVDINDSPESAIIYLVKKVVSEVENENMEITLKDAKKYNKNAKMDDDIKIDVTPVGYGRIAAQSAKQVIIQRVQEAERDVMYELFKDRENELINALVHRVDNNQVYINLEDKITTVLPPEHQIPHERYYAGQRVKLYLEKVIKTTKGPQLLISRSHPNLVQKLFELEIPEIKAGTVEIKGIARDPGVRSKVAVNSLDPKIDPIGSCVGQKGVRVQSIMDELNGERIDIIEWNENMAEYIKAALAPAKINNIVIDEHRRHVKIYVHPDQRPLAIGKKGQNVQLASGLTKYEIDILDISELKEIKEQKVITDIHDLPKIPADLIEKLDQANLSKVEQLDGLSEKDLMDIEGVTKEEADYLIKAIKNVTKGN